MTRRNFSLLAITFPLWGEAARAQERGLWWNSSELPVSRIAEKEGRVEVNMVRLWADSGDTTWLVTRLGVKAVSRSDSAPPRHYTVADGLPGYQITDIVADAQGVYIRVSLPNQQEALCTLDRTTDTWKTVAQWGKREYEWNIGYPANNLMALGQDVVVVCSPRVETSADAPFYCFCRKSNEPLKIPWDPAIQTDHDFLATRFVACQGQRILLGTQLGLLELSLADNPPKSWNRHLAKWMVHMGKEAGENLYLWLGERLPEFRRERMPFIYGAGGAYLVNTSTWQMELLPMPPITTYGGTETMVVDEAGALWRWCPQDYRSPQMLRWKSGEKAWTSVPEKEVTGVPARLAGLDLHYARPGGWLKAHLPHWLTPGVEQGETLNRNKPAYTPPTLPSNFALPAQNLSVPTVAGQVFELEAGRSLVVGQEIFLVTDGGKQWHVISQAQISSQQRRDRAPHFFVYGEGIAKNAYMVFTDTCDIFKIDTDKLEVSNISGPKVYKNLIYYGYSSSGVWFLDHEKNTLKLFDLDKKSWSERSLPDAPNGLKLQAIHKTMDGWTWATYVDSSSAAHLHGWNIEKNVWSPTGHSPLRDEYPISDGKGGFYGMYYGMGQNATIHAWHSGENFWRTFTQDCGGVQRLIAVGDDGLYFLDWERFNVWDVKQCLIHVPTPGGKTHEYPLPDIGFPTGGENIRPIVTPKAIFLSAEHGLWRFDRTRKVWEEWRMPLSTAQMSPNIRVQLSGEKEYWGQLQSPGTRSTTLFQWNASTGKAKVFNEKFGLPDHYEGQLLAVGDTVWLAHKQGAYRFDRATQRFVREVSGPVSLITASADGSNVWMVGYTRRTASRTLFRWNRKSQQVKRVTATRSTYHAMIPHLKGVLVATYSGLFFVDESDVWTQIDIWGLAPDSLVREGKYIWALTSDKPYTQIRIPSPQ